MNQITTVPDSVSQAGYTFNYALWTAGTVVTLCNVPWDSDYRTVVKFPARNGLDVWMNTLPNRLVINQMSPARLNQPIKISTPFELASQYNYIRATNPAQPVAGSMPSTYYYFIKSVEYGAPNTTILNIQLDVWATFNWDVEFGRMYLERGHYGIANSRQLEEQGRRYLTVPEGMDLGGEMEIAHTWRKGIATARGADTGGSGETQGYDVMVTMTIDLEDVPAAQEHNPDGSPVDVKIMTATGNRMENLPNGSAIYFFRSMEALQYFLSTVKDRAWITQAITSIVAVPPLETIGVPTEIVERAGLESGVIRKPKGGTIPQSTEILADDWTSELGLPARYANLHKFKVSPYSVIELTTYDGQPLILKPESMNSKAIDVKILYHLNPGSGRITIIPRIYNAGQGSNSFTDSIGTVSDAGEWMDFATSITNFPSFTTVNSSTSAYLLANKNQIAFQHKSASWDQQRAMMGAQTAYGQATSGMGLTENMANAGIARNSQQAAVNNQAISGQGALGMAQGFMGAAGQAGRGNMVGAAMNGVTNMGSAGANMLIQMNQNNQSTSVNNAYSSTAMQAQTGNQGYNRDTNLDLASSVAQGDYANAIAGIQAKVQDANMLQPTTSGQVGGNAFNLATIGWSVFAKLKRMHGTAVTEIGEYWLRYGYRVNRWVTPPQNLLVCEHFSYWQGKDVTVFSEACPEMYRQTIRGILETGVTVYDHPDHIGRIDPADNEPLDGISY